MNGLSIIQACLALSFFKCLPEHLINRVFNMEFIQRLEDEIKMCYSKATYPERILNQVMQLNRAVCLDYPEARVPWFQQNYIEAQLTKRELTYFMFLSYEGLVCFCFVLISIFCFFSNFLEPKIETLFQVDVKRMLVSLIPEAEMLQTDVVTPYGYRIDFVLNYDRNNRFISPPTAGESDISSSSALSTTKTMSNNNSVAILLPKLESFCENNIYFFRGQEYLKQRHLEMLGYRVIHINYSEWNSMYMNVKNAKIDYLKTLLKIS